MQNPYSRTKFWLTKATRIRQCHLPGAGHDDHHQVGWHHGKQARGGHVLGQATEVARQNAFATSGKDQSAGPEIQAFTLARMTRTMTACNVRPTTPSLTNPSKPAGPLTLTPLALAPIDTRARPKYRATTIAKLNANTRGILFWILELFQAET